MSTVQTAQPTLTADIALLSADQQVLLIKRRNWPCADMWALPGGMLNQGETLEAAAIRELYEETSIESIALTQYRTYSDPDRDPRGHVISTVFVAEIASTESITVRAGDDAKEAQWFPLTKLPALAFDHAAILGDIRQEQPHVNEQVYLQEILRTYVGSDTARDELCLGALGLAGEAGEVVDQIKKFLYQGHGLDPAKMCDELGDVLWYFVLICHATGSTLKEAMRCNMEKLRKRYPDGFAAERSIHRS